MYPSKKYRKRKQIKKRTTLVAAVKKAAGLVETLSGKDHLTFAPKQRLKPLPQGNQKRYKPENKQDCINRYPYPSCGCRKSRCIDVLALIENGRAAVTTVAGGTLTFYTEDGAMFTLRMK
jgi:hypothetical protein